MSAEALDLNKTSNQQLSDCQNQFSFKGQMAGLTVKGMWDFGAEKGSNCLQQQRQHGRQSLVFQYQSLIAPYTVGSAVSQAC